MAATEVVAPSGVAEVVSVEALLAPIPGDNPSGEDTRYTGLQDEIREARRAEDNLVQGDWVREPKTADWATVEILTVDALTNKTKDLQICAWMNEALIKNYGFAGLRDGLKVMTGLHEKFWETVYPEVDDGDMEGRANSLSWLDRQTAIVVKEVNITKASGLTDLTFLDFEESKQFDIPENVDSLESDAYARAVALRDRATAEGRVTGEDWRKTKTATRRAYYEEINSLLNECWTEFQALDRVMDEKFDRQTPGLGLLKKALEDLRSLVDKLVKEKRILEPDPVEATADGKGGEVGADGSITGGSTGGGSSTGPVRSRQEALNKLNEVADYFRRAEPHSPVSYLVQRAVKWGNMPLESWLEEVIKDGGVLTNLRETLGLQNGDGSGGESGTSSY